MIYLLAGDRSYLRRRPACAHFRAETSVAIIREIMIMAIQWNIYRFTILALSSSIWPTRWLLCSNGQTQFPCIDTEKGHLSGKPKIKTAVFFLVHSFADVHRRRRCVCVDIFWKLWQSMKNGLPLIECSWLIGWQEHAFALSQRSTYTYSTKS